jgi:hypothetical protein
MILERGGKHFLTSLMIPVKLNIAVKKPSKRILKQNRKNLQKFAKKYNDILALQMLENLNGGNKIY